MLLPAAKEGEGQAWGSELGSAVTELLPAGRGDKHPSAPRPHRAISGPSALTPPSQQLCCTCNCFGKPPERFPQLQHS